MDFIKVLHSSGAMSAKDNVKIKTNKTIMNDESAAGGADTLLVFKKKVWIVGSIITLIVALFWFFKATFGVFLLILAGAMIALFFHGFAGVIERYIHLSRKISMFISILLTVVIIALMLWFMGSKIVQQVTELTQTLPSTINAAREQLAKTSLGQKVLEKTSSTETAGRMYTFVRSFFTSTFGVFGNLYLVLFLGIFFTVSPKTYINGFLLLIPPEGKQEAKVTIERVGYTLTKWLKGQLFAMLIIFTFSGIGLTILDIPMAIALALIAGLLNFIPNLGPLIAMVPAVLVALTQGVDKALLVAALYLFIQTVEGNIITPNIQKKLINIPPALTILAQSFMGILNGGWGLVLATPLVAMVMVVVEEIYVKKINKPGTKSN